MEKLVHTVPAFGRVDQSILSEVAADFDDGEGASLVTVYEDANDAEADGEEPP